MSDPQLKCEVRRLSSQWPNGAPMYPGFWLFTWIQPRGMPWLLMSIEPYTQGA